MKRKKEQKKRTLREEWALLWRAVRLWNRIMPHFWFWQILCTILETFSPYFALYMSARMINELTGTCDFSRLLRLAGITVGGGFLLAVLGKFTQSRRDIKDYLMWNRHEAYMTDVQNKMKYEHLENPDVILLRSQISANMNATGGGMLVVKWAFSGLLGGILDVAFSVSLTVSMFTMRAQGDYTGIFAFINSPFSAALIAGMIFVSAFFSIRIFAARSEIMDGITGDLAQENTRYSAYSRLWGADMTLFGLHRIVIEEFRKYQLRPKWVLAREKVSIRYSVISAFCDTFLNLAIFLFVAAKVYIGVFGIGNFILYQGTVSRFVNAVSSIATEIGRLRYNNKYLVDLYKYLDLSREEDTGEVSVEPSTESDWSIEFCDVSFKYPRTDTWVLRHVNIKLKSDEKMAIVGENGSGKTTFIKLLCRFFTPTEGKILLNGRNIADYRYDEYIKLFSVVLQDFTLFAFPLGENVAANRFYDEAKVRDCLTRSGLDKKINKLDGTSKNALEYAIGREYDVTGIEFSGGERQKIALARALYKDAPFIILDEPTSALDPIAEAAVYEDFGKIVKNKAAVFISHRLSSCRFCDSIAVFDGGKLVQQGSHDLLIRDTQGKYCMLWNAQAQYYT